MAELVNHDLPATLRKRLPAKVPVFRLGRLATSITQRGKGIGHILREEVGCCHSDRFRSPAWGCFRALIAAAIEEIKVVLGDKAHLVMQTIYLHVQRFFVQALQLNPLQLRMEAA